MRCMLAFASFLAKSWRYSRRSSAAEDLSLATSLKVVAMSKRCVVIDKPADLRSVPGFGPTKGRWALYEERAKTATAEELQAEFGGRKTRRARFAEVAKMTDLLPEKLRLSGELPRTKHRFLKHCTARVGGKMAPEDALSAWIQISRAVRAAEIEEGLEESDSVVRRIQAVYEDACPVHRLDMATSGLLCVALDSDAASFLSSQWARRDVVKKYLALVRGCPPLEEDRIDLPLLRLPKEPHEVTRVIVSADGGKPSLTSYLRLHYDPVHNYSLLELTPHTGRLHQLRAHLAAIGFPILGDDIYGESSANYQHRRDFLVKGKNRLCLHASHLAFDDPDDSIDRWSLVSRDPDFLSSDHVRLSGQKASRSSM